MRRKFSASNPYTLQISDMPMPPLPPALAPTYLSRDSVRLALHVHSSVFVIVLYFRFGLFSSSYLIMIIDIFIPFYLPWRHVTFQIMPRAEVPVRCHVKQNMIFSVNTVLSRKILKSLGTFFSTGNLQSFTKYIETNA